jgi:SAM-dependent methyltransferase
MSRFYGLPATRDAYQAMIDAEDSAQPQTESALRGAILAGDPRSVLEVGCGSGRIYKRLRDAGMMAAYTGVEMSEKVIRQNKECFPEGSWVCGSGYDLPVAKESQDRVFSYYVLEHCAFPKRFLESLLSVVKPGGSLLLTFPDMAASGIFGSQALGWGREMTAKEHLISGRIFHAMIRLFDSRVRLPIALSRATVSPGPFPVNLNPQCLEPGVRIVPDVDAIYVATREEVASWAVAQGCKVSFPGGKDGILRVNVLIEIAKPA